MATIREGSKAALVVVDGQVGVMNKAWEAEKVVQNIALSVDRARAQGVPVIWVQHADEDLEHGSAAWEWVPELVRAPNERLIHKNYNSSFEQTSLDADLAALGVSHIVLAGAATNWCIRATAYGALERGYDLTLVKDAHSTKTMKLDDGTSLEAVTLIRDLNIAMTWLNYPGRSNGTAKAASIDFAAPAGKR